MEYIFSYLHFFAALVYMSLAVLILIKDIRSPLNLTCSTIFICMFVWSLSYIFIHHPAATHSTIDLFENISSVGWIWFTYVHLWFAWLYSRRKPFKFFTIVVILLTVVPVLLQYQQLLHQSLVAVHFPRDFGWMFRWNPTRWLLLFLVYYSIAVFLGLALLFDCRNRSRNLIVKRQTSIMLGVGVVALIIGSITNVILPLVMTTPPVPLADVTTLIWAIGLAYVVFKYRMLDITPFIAAKEIIKVMKDLLFLLDIERRIISVNPSTLETLGYSNDDLVGRQFDDFITENDIMTDTRVDHDTSALVSGETYLTCRSGKRIPVVLATESIPGTGTVCVASDITLQKQKTELLHGAKQHLESEVARATRELKRANETLTKEVFEKKQAVLALTESEERFKAIFEHAPNGIYLADLEGTIVDENREMLRIFGFKKNELNGKNILDLNVFRSNGQEKIAGLLADNRLSRDSGSGEVAVMHADGTMLDVEIMSHPVKIGDRNLVLGVVHDISMRKKAEEETEILKLELHHAQKMDAIGRLAGGIAHDFNNLLAGIMGYAGLLRKKIRSAGSDENEALGKIIAVAKQASMLTTQLLAFARKGKYQIEELEMHSIIDDVVELLEHTIDKRISLKKRYDAPSSMVNGDRSQLHSALLNLGINAKDALAAGGHITFATAIVTKENQLISPKSSPAKEQQYLEVAISDNGSGMDSDTRSQIFEPFFTTKSTGRGTGLGLASVYGTVKQHNGSIQVYSEPGRGTTFTICLPLITSTVSRIPPEKPVDVAGRRSGRILVVDDVALLREMAVEVLSDLGYEVEACEDGAKALDWYQEHHKRCDLVLLDMTMPGISGADCFRRMKQINPSVKVIIATGHAKENEVESICSEGVAAFMQKPFEIEHLAKTVAEVLAATT